MAYSRQEEIGVLVASGMPKPQARALIHLQEMRETERSTRIWKLISAVDVAALLGLLIALLVIAAL